MKSPHILLAGGNVKRLQMNLVNVIDASAMRAIEEEININTKKLYLLGQTHFLFAIKQNKNAWRQKVSRLYCGGYNASRAVRLCVSGDYNTTPLIIKKLTCYPTIFLDSQVMACS